MIDQLERRRIDAALSTFAARHFEEPAACSNGEQIRFYVRELCLKIDEYERLFNYVPTSAYLLLARYNARQNSLLYQEFIRSYPAAP